MTSEQVGKRADAVLQLKASSAEVRSAHCTHKRLRILTVFVYYLIDLYITCSTASKFERGRRLFLRSRHLRRR